MNVTVDRDLCIGCGTCEEVCPEVFRIREDGLSYVMDEQLGPELYESVRDAMASCPVSAITVTGG